MAENPSRVASSSSLKDLGTDSDPDNKERPIREKLKQTSIDTVPADTFTSDSAMSESGDKDAKASIEGSEPSGSENGSGVQIRRKRSFEDMETAGAVATTSTRPERHTRKKSRDVGSAEFPSGASEGRSKSNDAIVEEPVDQKDLDIDSHTTASESVAKDLAPLNGERTRHTTPPAANLSKDAIASPKNKRNRDDDETLAIDSTKDNAAKPTTTEEPKTKRIRDSPQPATSTEEQASVPKKSGFGNTSAASPFGALVGSKSPPQQKQTSASAFTASGFGALASSSASPFGTLGGSQVAKSPFGAGSDKKSPITFASAGASPSVFGSALGASEKSPFTTAAPASGFGALSKGFGGAASGSRLTSFAGGSGPSITGLGGKSAKPFGAQAAEEEAKQEDSSGGEEDEDDVQNPEDDKKDPRFHEQDISTGEEAEDEIFKCRAKLYNYTTVSETSDKKEWKERGMGDLKLLVSKGDLESGGNQMKGRFVMRADKSHRLLLNSPIIKNGKYGSTEGDIPKGGFLFMGSIDGKPVELLQLKMKTVNAEEMWNQVMDIQKQM